MRTADYFLLMASIFIAPALPKGVSLTMWLINMVAFIMFFFMERFP